MCKCVECPLCCHSLMHAPPAAPSPSPSPSTSWPSAISGGRSAADCAITFFFTCCMCVCVCEECEQERREKKTEKKGKEITQQRTKIKGCLKSEKRSTKTSKIKKAHLGVGANPLVALLLRVRVERALHKARHLHEPNHEAELLALGALRAAIVRDRQDRAWGGGEGMKVSE